MMISEYSELMFKKDYQYYGYFNQNKAQFPFVFLLFPFFPPLEPPSDPASPTTMFAAAL